MTDLSQGRAQEALGHDAEGRQLPSRALEQIVNDILLDMETKPRLMDGRGNAMLVGVQHLPGLQVLRAVLPGRLQGQVRHRHQLRAAGRRHLQGGLRRGRDREAAPVRDLPPDAGRPLQRAGRQGDEQGRAVREGRQGAVHQRAGPDAAAHRGRQAADRLRRPAAPPTSTSTRRCRTTACSRPSAASTGSTATTRTTATSSTTATCSTRSRPPSPTTPAAPSTATRRRTSRAC